MTEYLNKSKEEDELDQISASQHEITNNFTIVPNSLIRDQNISPECRWLIIYFLSNLPGWKIKRAQLVNHVKGYIGRDKILKVFDEGIEAGYIKKEVILRKKSDGKGFLRGYKYAVASTPIFKKCLRHPEYQDTDHQEPDGQGADGQGGKEYYPKENKENNTTTPLKQKPIPPKPRKSGGGIISFNRQTKKFDNVTPEFIELLKETYPGVDVVQQMKEMIIWLLLNPHRDGTQGFITNWLKKNMQDNPIPKAEVEEEIVVDPDMAEMMRQRDAKIKREMDEKRGRQNEG